MSDYQLQILNILTAKALGLITPEQAGQLLDSVRMANLPGLLREQAA